MLRKKYKQFVSFKKFAAILLIVVAVLTMLSSPLALAAKASGGGTDYQQAPIDCNSGNLDKSNCGIIQYLVIFINVLSGLVGLAIVASITVAGIQYTTSGNDPQKISAAKGRIVNSLIALAAFIFMYAFLQWVVPGGIF